MRHSAKLLTGIALSILAAPLGAPAQDAAEAKPKAGTGAPQVSPAQERGIQNWSAGRAAD